jgi:hypothetical protein
MLFTAPSGWGKSPLIGTADQRGTGGPKAIALAVDPEGLVSAAFAGSTIDMIEAHTFARFLEALAVVKPKIFSGEYQIMAIDSITELQRSMMRSDLDKQFAQSPLKRDKDVPAQDNYLRTQMQLVDMVKELNSWPCTTIWTAQQTEWYDSEGETYYTPMIHGTKGMLAQEIMGYMMIQANGEFVDPEDEDDVPIRRMWFSTHGAYRARDRTGKLPKFLDSPTVPQIMEYVSSKSAPAPKKAVRRPLNRKVVK